MNFSKIDQIQQNKINELTLPLSLSIEINKNTINQLTLVITPEIRYKKHNR